MKNEKTIQNEDFDRAEQVLSSLATENIFLSKKELVKFIEENFTLENDLRDELVSSWGLNDESKHD